LIEEQLVEVPQVQLAEAIKQVPKEVLQARQRGIPKVTTQVVEKVQAVSVPLINEVAMDVPQVQVVEVMKQTAALSQQRLVQQSTEFVGQPTTAFRTMAEERAGVYNAPVVGVRENAMIQPTVVERLSPVMTTGLATTYGQQVGEVMMAAETIVAPTYVETVAPTYVETVAPTYVETVVAPTAVVEEVVQVAM